MPNIFIVFEKDPYHKAFENQFSSVGLNTTAIRYGNLISDIKIAEEADLFFLDLTRFSKRSFLIGEIHDKFPELPIIVSHMQDELSHSDLGEFENVIEFVPQPVSIPDLTGRILNAWHGYVSELGKGAQGVSGFLQDQNLIVLIQAFTTQKQSGMIQMETEMNQGRIYFKNGVLIDVQYKEMPPDLALRKMLLWLEGRFHATFYTPEQKNQIKQDTETILTEGLERISKFLSLRDSVGGPEQKLYSLTRFNPENIDTDEQKILQSFVMGKTISAFLAGSEADDLQELDLLVKLFETSFLFKSKTQRDEADEKNKGIGKIFSRLSIFSKAENGKKDFNKESKNETAESKDEAVHPYIRRYAVAQLNELKEKLKVLAKEQK